MTEQKTECNTNKCVVDVQLTNSPIGPREYIYNLVPQPRPNLMTRYACLPKIRQKQYEFVENPKKEPMRTMGPPSHDRLSPVVYPNKHEYLRKQSKLPFTKLHKFSVITDEKNSAPQRPDGARRKARCPVDPKPPLPSTKSTVDVLDTSKIPSKCLHRERHKINWVTRNAIAAITQEPGSRVPPENRRWMVDTRKGDRFPLQSNRTVSGLEPIYVYKTNNGKVPSYIKRRAKMVKRTQKLLAHYINEKELQTTDYLLTDEQRKELLNGLKAAWDRYNRKYLGLASMNDTIKGKAYKLYLEQQLDALKADIDLVENHQFLFVEAPKDSNDDQSVITKICV